METNRSIGEVLQDILSNLQEIVRGEFRLAKAETRKELATVAQSSRLLAAGGVIGFFAVGFSLLAVMFALEIVMAPWLAAVIVAFGTGIIAVPLLLVGKNRISDVRRPQRTVRTVKENIQWTKQQAR